MTASLRRHRPCSSAAPPPLEDDDLLAEILLHLPPLPSSLPRISAVCKRWRSLASDTRFLGDMRQIHFQSSLEAPNRIPQGRFQPLGCRHGLVLSFHVPREQLLVWDPVSGDQHCLEIPPGFDSEKNPISAAVHGIAEDAQHCQVVLVGTSGVPHTHGAASVYSSKTCLCLWGNLITAPVPAMFVCPDMPAVMIGDSLYWLLDKDSTGILEFDLGRRSLGVISLPGEEIIMDEMDLGYFWVIMAEGGGLGFLLLSGFIAQLWMRNTNSDGVASWALQKTIALDKLLNLMVSMIFFESFARFSIALIALF